MLGDARVKVCCIASPREARIAISHGASALGLVSAMPSGPGPIPERRIAEIAATLPPGVTTLLLTSRTDPGEIAGQQRRTRVNAIQLCDRLPPAPIRAGRPAPALLSAGLRRLAAAVPLAGLGLPTAGALLAGLALSAPADAQEAPPPFAIRDVRVFDGAIALDSQTVVIERGVIVAMGRAARIPEGAEVIDGAGHTLLPGLIDAHAHAIFVDHLRQALVFGVTTELDMFTSHRQAASIKAAQAEGGGLEVADLFSAGTLVTAPGGHGTQYGLPIPTVGGPEEADAFVEARVAEGSDYIKVVYDDRGPDAVPFPSIGRATLEAVVEAAHEREKLAVVHATRRRAAREAIEAGADGLAHIFSDSMPESDFGRFAREHGAFVIPTLSVTESASGVPGGASLVRDPDLAPYLGAEDRENLRGAFPRSASYEVARAAVRLLDEAGVPILAGTDAPNPGTAHGASMHRELELLVEAGLTPLEALTAATSAPASAFGLRDRGRIAPGKRADLVLVRGDPTAEIADARRIVRVWKLGVAADREAYRRRIGAPRGARR